MMNHHLPAGPSHMNMNPPPSMSSHQPSHRQQEYHNQQFHGQMPHSPVPMHNPYAAYHHGPPQYYAHPAQHMGYPPRWQPQQYVPAAYQMPPPQYPPRSPMSPMIVSSQPPPQTGSSATPGTRQHAPNPYMPPPLPPPSSHSPTPRSTSQTPSSYGPPHTIPSPTRPDSVQPSNPPAPTSRRSSVVTSQSSPPTPSRRMPFYPELPWYSHPDEAFPAKALKRRRKRQDLVETSASVALPSREAADTPLEAGEAVHSDASTLAAPSAAPSLTEQETPATSQAPSEVDLLPTPPATSAAQDEPKITAPQIQAPPATPQTHGRKNTRTAVPIIPAVPNIPSRLKTGSSEAPSTTVLALAASSEQADSSITADEKAVEAEVVASPPAKAAPAIPKSWADLVRSKNASAAAAAASAAANGVVAANGTGASRTSSVAEALKQYNVDHDEKIAFLEPRGLVNTGNMCYMNSILQILVFCTPFYNFLDQVSKRAAHSFKSDTPLVDAMIMFMKDFKVIDSAESAEKLRFRLKQEELEHYGSPITPEYVYDVIKRLPRFSSMRRGHQQDAEEFLGFLLAGMHDECATVTRLQPDTASSDDAADVPAADNGWLEVGPKQKASITRESGDLNTSPSPLTHIFGGQLRSELRVSGLKNSVTLEPYQPLQLDIGAPQINNITDALRNLTKPETLTGDFGGRDQKATKQVFIETLPPVLILHLKRFQYDNTGGTQKIWKKIGYPLQLEIPKEVFAPQKRGALGIKGEPKYRLISVVYHHGKSAAGGHYTVDILRQDEREWVRVDDTVIRRIRAEDVAEGGAEEDPKVLARALEQHANDSPGSKRNLFEGLEGGDGNEDGESVRSWNEVNGSNSTSAKNKLGAAGLEKKDKEIRVSGKSTPARRELGGGVRDNKVAYILLYERVKD